MCEMTNMLPLPLFANRTKRPVIIQQPYNPFCVCPIADRANVRRFEPSALVYRT